MSKLSEFQEQLSEKVKGNFLLHLFINDVKFLIAAIILTPLAIGGILLIPKIWEVTPEDFRPRVKISGLDYIQSITLARTARQREAEGDYETALYSWHAAIANHPTKTDNLRSAIASFLKLDRPTPKQVQQNLNYSIWLLRLNKTNFVDLAVIAESLDRSRMDQLQFSLLDPLKDKLTEPMRAAYSRSLFNLLKHQEFNTQWQQLSEETRAAKENALYGSAYAALWGSPEESVQGRLELERTDADEDTRLLARQLLLLVHFQQKNEKDYEKVLTDLRQDERDRYTHHLGFWTLLLQLGKTEQALARATDFDQVPTNINDLINHVNLFRQLGAPERADALLTAHLNTFPPEVALYSTFADLLIELSDWDRLRNIAIGLRKLSTESTAISLSHYLEGTADAKQNRRNSAALAFEKFASSVSKEDLSSEMGIAKELIALGFSSHALKLLEQIESKYLQDPNYWYTRAGCAFRTKAYAKMKLASEQALALAPDNSHYKSALAESLLLLREEPAQIIRLTLELITENPNSFSHHINHVLALLLNQRVDEAAALLRKIPEESAPDAQARAAHHYAQFGVAFLEGNYAKAQEISDLIPTSLLSQRELEWFTQCRETLKKQL